MRGDDMKLKHSFLEFIQSHFSEKFWTASEEYLKVNQALVEEKVYKLHKIGNVEILDARAEHVWIEDRPDMDICFHIALSVSCVVGEGAHHYDNYEEVELWLVISCSGNLDKKLEDFRINSISDYNGKNRNNNPMDSSLVPIIPDNRLEEEAENILSVYYPEALSIKARGSNPVCVDPMLLASRMGLTIKQHQIRENSSVFGQLYFKDAVAKLYDEEKKMMVPIEIEAGTIIVDPNTYLLRNIGSVNNTIIHECVHWNKHMKAFKLEELYNDEITNISCEVVGSAEGTLSKKSMEFMEMQANKLTPRIQMPKSPFIAKAREYIDAYMRHLNVNNAINVMEPVIDRLAEDFGASRQAVKVRLINLGFEDAVGTFTYVDGHYVKPHSFKKGAIAINQTFTISACDAAIQRKVDCKLREKTNNGDYIFVDNHYVYNVPHYVQASENGKLELTDYARTHMDECCLIFDMKMASKISTEYSSICYLNREKNSYSYEIKFHDANIPIEKQVEIRKKEQEEARAIRMQMTDDPSQCMKLLLEWKKMDYTELADEIEISDRTIRRIVNEGTIPKFENAVLICFGLNLPPSISRKFLEVLGYRFIPGNTEHQWIEEALYVKYMEPIWEILEYLKLYGVIFPQTNKILEIEDIGCPSKVADLQGKIYKK